MGASGSAGAPRHKAPGETALGIAGAPQNKAPGETATSLGMTLVTLNVYDLAPTLMNRVLRPLGAGVFHCGVEIYGLEWSYSNEGVFYSQPRECEGHCFSESLLLGMTRLSSAEVAKLIEDLERRWPVAEYNLLTRNCLHFSDELSARLGVGQLPDWVMNPLCRGAVAGVTLSAALASVEAGGRLWCCSHRSGRSTGALFEREDVLVPQLPAMTQGGQYFSKPLERKSVEL